ncbi:MAG TPA: AraC family transcriptional regulator [Gemmataceae bacterium]|nr:AraC family transcriptional regulator [Gemmataceae bacterium]
MRAGKSAEIYHKRINRVIDHIKDHLTETLSVERLARLVHFSPFHFHRIFRSLVGEPLHAFVQRKRLEKAVTQMLYGPSATLTKIALQSGFASSSDFSRTFKQKYEFSPSRFSRERYLQESKIRQDLLANAGYGFGKLPDGRNHDRFRVRLVDRPAQWVAYERVIGSFDMQKIVAAFDRLTVYGKRQGLIPGAQLIGMTLDDPDITPMKKFRFDWCLVLPQKPKPRREDEMSLGVIPANRFAVVHCRGDIQKEERAWRHLFHTWLPASGYQPTHDPMMEVYRRSPPQPGWETFDIDCCLPVRPLGR